MYGDIECPYCGYERKATWDDNEGSAFEEVEFQCGQCEGFFLVDCEAHVEFTFISRRYEVEELEE